MMVVSRRSRRKFWYSQRAFLKPVYQFVKNMTIATFCHHIMWKFSPWSHVKVNLSKSVCIKGQNYQSNINFGHNFRCMLFFYIQCLNLWPWKSLKRFIVEIIAIIHEKWVFYNLSRRSRHEGHVFIFKIMKRHYWNSHINLLEC